MTRLTFTAAFFLAAVCPLAAQVTQIPLTNAGFEADTVVDGSNNGSITDWPGVPGALAVTFNPSNAQTGLPEAPEGANCAGLNGGAEISQLVTTTVSPGMSYQLSFLVGYTNGSGAGQPYRAGMRIGGVTVRVDSPQVFAPAGGFRLASVTYTHPASALPAASLEVFLGHTGTGGSIIFDDVKLHEVPRYGATPHTTVDFECQAAGTVFQPGVNADCEDSYQAFGPGAQIVLPDGTNVTGPCAGMPTQGGQWAEINNTGTGPVGGAPGTSRLDNRLYAYGEVLSIDWNFLTEEGTGGSTFFDTAKVLLWDLSSGSFVFNSSFPLASTQDASLPWVSSSCTSGLGTGTFSSELDGVQTLIIDIPPSLVGRPIAISFDVTNNGDNSVESALFVDNIRFEVPVPRPGTNEGVVMGTGISSVSGPTLDYGLITGGSGNTTKEASAGDTLLIGYFDQIGTFVNVPVYVLGQFFTTGGPDPSTPFTSVGLWINQSYFFFVHGTVPTPFGPLQTLPAGGMVHSYPVPSGLSGVSMLVQVAARSSLAANGFLATTDAHVIVFQ